MKLKALRQKSAYKNTSTWLDAVYRNNKQVIDSAIRSPDPKMSKKSQFKQLVKEYMDEGLSPTKALNTLARTETFTPEAERLRSNAIKGLKRDKAAAEAFRRAKGWNEKFDESKMKYDKENHIYVYDERVTISFRQSPEGIDIGVIGYEE